MQARHATEQELEHFPARLALTDAMKHSRWMEGRYQTLEQEFPDLAWNEVMVSPRLCFPACLTQHDKIGTSSSHHLRGVTKALLHFMNA